MLDNTLIRELESGALRVAAPQPDGTWLVNLAVKERIINFFRSTPMVDMGDGEHPHYRGCVDKVGLWPRQFAPEDTVRIAPGGTSVRPGTFLGKNVVIMTPCFVNMGAYIDDKTMLDSHVLVGSCAQIGKRVHLSTAVQIGGVLEPAGNRPVIVEDDCFIGAGVILTEGIWVRERAVLAPGLALSASVPIYDVVHQKVYKGEIPPNAVVVPGTRPLASSRTLSGANHKWAQEHGLGVNCGVIIKYRDDKTDSSVKIEEAFR